MNFSRNAWRTMGVSQRLHMNFVHTKGMRKALAAAVVTTALFSLSSVTPPAMADVAPTPAPTTTPLTPFEQYRIDRENYFAAMKVITTAFKSACDKANSTYLTSIAVAKNKDQKRAARLAREGAITAATIEFEGAKNALGPMPVEPPRMAKAPGKNKVKLR
jgi:hypothetical protein